MRLVFDLEGTGLLDHTSIDYTASPYRLLPDFHVHCLVAKDIDTKEKFRFVRTDKLYEPIQNFKHVLKKAKTLIGHNIIDFDLMVLKLYGVIEDFFIADDYRECLVSIDGESYEMEIFDTLVVSKTMNPDRYGGHSLDEWGKRVGVHKIDWRAEAVALGLIEYSAPKGAEFKVYHPKMLEYNEQDVDTNEAAYYELLKEWGDWDWHGPVSLESQVRSIVTLQQHRGFWFNRTLAEANVRELDEKMEAIRAIVEPLIPAKPMGVTKLKQYLPPKIQFKKSGEVSAVMMKWVERHEGKLEEYNGVWNARLKDNNGVDKLWPLPMDGNVAIKTHEAATVKDTTHIKGWLVELGWTPTAYKERDLTCDSKKNKLSQEKFQAAVERYVEQTLASPFCRDRCDHLEVSPKGLLAKLLKHDLKRPMKVYTNPTLTVGSEKEMDPKLLELADKFPHAKLVSEFLTYSHRRNSILGGGQEVFDEDERDEEDEYAGKGFLAAERIGVDGRIPTPADTCGAGTSRFKHRLVANVPRVTSLYGDKMRGLFGTDPEEPVFQLGYDFASLEARIESHYCWRYDEQEEHPYCLSLIREKPNDVHTITAGKVAAAITEWAGKPTEFGRTPAKNVKYCCSYGGQPKRVAKTIGVPVEVGEVVYNAFWDSAKPLALLAEKLKDYWTKKGQKKYVLGLDGRKIPTRSASALINSLFQSAGVIAAKRAMVIYDKLLREKGLYCDFFREDWRNKVWVQQLIAYHDECQLEVHKSLIKWKMARVTGPFEIEVDGKKEDSPAAKAAKAELKAFKKDNPGWSEIGHSDKGFYIGRSIASDLITQAVDEAGKFYKLNVPLGADFIFGRNWGECH